MIRRSFAMGAAAAALSLSACGGGSSPSPTPTPTPTTTPTPTPTPVAYSSFPLTTATEFATLDAFTSFSGDLAAGPVTLGAAGTEIGSTRFRLAVLPDPTTATTGAPQVVRENTEETRFVGTNIVTAPATTVTEYSFTQTGTTAGQTSTALFLNNTVTGKVTTDTTLNLLRTSYAGWLRTDATNGANRYTFGVWGYPTIASDLPTTGTATYTAKISGRGVAAAATGGATLSTLTGNVTITVNFATGLVTYSATVNSTVGAVTAVFGTVSGTGAYGTGATQFTGSFGPTSPLAGTVAGTFFGPQAAEIGITFAGSGVIAGKDTRIVGVIVGKKI